MLKVAVPATGTQSAAQASWFPMIIIALAQIQMAFNVSALPVSIGAIVEEFDTSPFTISAALVVYLATAGISGYIGIHRGGTIGFTRRQACAIFWQGGSI